MNEERFQVLLKKVKCLGPEGLEKGLALFKEFGEMGPRLKELEGEIKEVAGKVTDFLSLFMTETNFEKRDFLLGSLYSELARWDRNIRLACEARNRSGEIEREIVSVIENSPGEKTGATSETKNSGLGRTLH